MTGKVEAAQRNRRGERAGAEWGGPSHRSHPPAPGLTLPQLLSQTQGHQPRRKSSKTPGWQISAMTAWSSSPHPHTSKSTECPDCRGNPPQSSSRIPSLHLKVLRSPQASSSSPLKDISSTSSAHLTSFSLTASSPQRCDLFPRALPASCPAAVAWGRGFRPLLAPSEDPSPALVQHWHRHAGEENLRAALQHKSAVPPLNTYRWIHQTLQKS